MPAVKYSTLHRPRPAARVIPRNARSGVDMEKTDSPWVAARGSGSHIDISLQSRQNPRPADAHPLNPIWVT